MKCMICDSPSEYFFSKSYLGTPFAKFMSEIGPVEFCRCSKCGFVFSRTHAQLEKNKWLRLNHDVHHYLENEAEKGGINQPPYAEQALSLALLGKSGLIDLNSMLDYAAGYGSLSKILDRYFGIYLPIYEPYVTDRGLDGYISEENLGKYKTVLNSAMFEHVVCRDDLEVVQSLVENDGVLVLHTLVCENVPQDPNWFYLAPPVHTAFHTNASMRILMRQWGYRSSAYSPKSKSWVLFPEDSAALDERLYDINRLLQCPWFLWQDGFVDYWKGF